MLAEQRVASLEATVAGSGLVVRSANAEFPSAAKSSRSRVRVEAPVRGAGQSLCDPAASARLRDQRLDVDVEIPSVGAEGAGGSRPLSVRGIARDFYRHVFARGGSRSCDSRAS